jgi:subtilisin family serine protease
MRNLILVFLAAGVWFQAGTSCAANADEPKFKIAIIDTGYDIHAPGTKLKLCQSGHYDFKSRRAVVEHTMDHGTKVASIIAERLKDVDYCAVILQVKGSVDFSIGNNVQALIQVAAMGVTAVNYSFDGYLTSVAERDALRLLANRGVGVFVAAGNGSKNLDYECDTFPACLDIEGMNVVGALDPNTNEIASYSNRGTRIKLWYSGRYHSQDKTDNGTSFATPRALSEYILSLDAKPVQTIIKLQSGEPHMRITNTPTLTTTSEN